MPADELFADAQRQLSICNSCRYCAGYCPVWPALELRTELTIADVTHLSNLCHDCRDCYSACMYTPPHEFALNPPALFAAVRERTYEDYSPAVRLPGWARGRHGVAYAVTAVAAILVVLSLLTTSGQAFGSSPGSAYELLSHLLMVGIVTAPAVVTIASVLSACWRYWAGTHGPARDLRHAGAWLRTLVQAARLGHQTGGGVGCDYPGSEPSNARRRWHHLVSYGFLLTMVSTVSAAASEYLFRSLPPYPYLSVPVTTGTLGGLAIAAGCTGLLVLKRRADPSQTTATTRQADLAFLSGLLVLAVTGLLVLLLRTTPAFGPMLVAHLAAVIVAFAIAPYTKFVHFLFRTLAIYKDNLERRQHAQQMRGDATVDRLIG